MFLFEVPSLSGHDEAAIVLQESELSEWRYCDLATSLSLLVGRSGPRLAAVFDGNRVATGLYLEDQRPLR
ncbi:MAG: hypothetical protein GXP35_18640 [Actinobacteria bacterium]|nr:hypothetical protein [Actinomycetota bacterium]